MRAFGPDEAMFIVRFRAGRGAASAERPAARFCKHPVRCALLLRNG